MDWQATQSDGSCVFSIPGCMDSTASNYASGANTDAGDCFHPAYGCTIASGTFNFDSTANANTACRFQYEGCTDSTAANYNPSANVAGGKCEYYVG